jgi:hypothetical protein
MKEELTIAPPKAPSLVGNVFVEVSLSLVSELALIDHEAGDIIHHYYTVRKTTESLRSR